MHLHIILRVASGKGVGGWMVGGGSGGTWSYQYHIALVWVKFSGRKPRENTTTACIVTVMYIPARTLSHTWDRLLLLTIANLMSYGWLQDQPKRVCWIRWHFTKYQLVVQGQHFSWCMVIFRVQWGHPHWGHIFRARIYKSPCHSTCVWWKQTPCWAGIDNPIRSCLLWTIT